MSLVKVENHPDLIKDMDSKAVLNTNYAALLEYKRKQQMVQEIDTLKSDVSEIKLLLNKIISSLDK
mgnify:CR=1 FL=1